MKRILSKKAPKYFKWTRTSTYMLSSFLLLLALIGYIWWPLVLDYLSTYNPEISFWRQMDWLLLGDFLVMSILITANANLKKDLPIILIGLMGGLVIESWGTQTSIWFYYTNERPPLWIIPAWPIASLSIDRLYRASRKLLVAVPNTFFKVLYWIMFAAFYPILLHFVWPTLHKSLTVMALVLCAFLIVTTRDHKGAILTFLAGSSLGYFLELWGTTRMCWTYYTYQTPPLFAVLAHGMAAVAFWRVLNLYKVFISNFFPSGEKSILQ